MFIVDFEIAQTAVFFCLFLFSKSYESLCQKMYVVCLFLCQSEGGAFMVPYDAELECKQNIVVYDSNTSELSDVEGLCTHEQMENCYNELFVTPVGITYVFRRHGHCQIISRIPL